MILNWSLKGSPRARKIRTRVFERPRTVPPKIMTHRREPRCKSRAPRDVHAACNKFRSAAAVARANATAGPGTQIHTRSCPRRAYLSSHSLSLCLALPQLFPLESKFPLSQLYRKYRDSVKRCSALGDQLKFYSRQFVLFAPYQLLHFTVVPNCLILSKGVACVNIESMLNQSTFQGKLIRRSGHFQSKIEPRFLLRGPIIGITRSRDTGVGRFLDVFNVDYTRIRNDAIAGHLASSAGRTSEFGEERTPNKGIAARETSARTGESPGDDR